MGSLNADEPYQQWPDEAGMAELQAGGWTVESDPKDERGITASAVILIPATVERLWSVITSCHYAFAFVDGLEFCEVMEDRGDYALTHQILDKGWTTPELDLVFETVRVPYQSMVSTMIEGNLKAMSGLWDFRQVEGGVMMRYTLILKPLLPAPHWLVRKHMKKDLPRMLRCIRALTLEAEDTKEQQQDMAECPGKLPED